MGMLGGLCALGASVLAGVSITWSSFTSTIYPYTIDQPSSFTHITINSGDHLRDAFFPALGSFTTNVNIYAERQTRIRDRQSVPVGVTGHRCGSAKIMSSNRTLYCAKFHGLAGKWSIEQTVFTSNGYTWHLTASCDVRYQGLHGIMLRMLRSFHVH